MYLTQAEAVEDTVVVFFVVRLLRRRHTSQTGWQNARFHSRQDDARSDRRGAATGARVEAEVTMQRWSVDPDQHAQAAMCKCANLRVVTRTKSLHRRRTRSL